MRSLAAHVLRAQHLLAHFESKRCQEIPILLPLQEEERVIT